MGSTQALIWSKETVRVGHQVEMKEKSQAAVIEPQFGKKILVNFPSMSRCSHLK